MGDVVISKKTFDIRKIFKQKAPGVSKWIPGFVYAYIERKFHQDELNKFLYKNRDKMGLDFVGPCLEFIGAKYEFIGVENIRPSGRLILAANHPIGGPEGGAIMQMVGKIRSDIKFFINDILMSLKNVQSMFVPVNKHGSNAEYLKVFDDVYESDNIILIFPAGLVSRKQNGKIRDLVWRSSFISRAVKHKRNIIPVHVEGKNSNFFYNLSLIRTKLGVKANLEMFFLADEMFKQKNKTIKITVGKEIPYTVFDKRLNYRRWAQLFKDYIYELKDDPNLILDDAYVDDKLSVLEENIPK